MSDKEKFLELAAMETVKSRDIRNLNISRDDLMDIYIKHPEYDFIILFLWTIHPDILDIIARNGDDRIKGFVCQKYPLLPKTYDFLLQQSEDVKLDLCGNKELPHHIAKRLLIDKSKEVRERIRWIIEHQNSLKMEKR